MSLPQIVFAGKDDESTEVSQESRNSETAKQQELTKNDKELVKKILQPIDGAPKSTMLFVFLLSLKEIEQKHGKDKLRDIVSIACKKSMEIRKNIEENIKSFQEIAALAVAQQALGEHEKLTTTQQCAQYIKKSKKKLEKEIRKLNTKTFSANIYTVPEDKLKEASEIMKNKNNKAAQFFNKNKSSLKLKKSISEKDVYNHPIMASLVEYAMRDGTLGSWLKAEKCTIGTKKKQYFIISLTRNKCYVVELNDVRNRDFTKHPLSEREIEDYARSTKSKEYSAEKIDYSSKDLPKVESPELFISQIFKEMQKK